MTRKILIIGSGSITEGLIPVLLKHGYQVEDLMVVTADTQIPQFLIDYPIHHLECELTEDNYELFLSMLPRPDVLLNLSVNVSSLALIKWCNDRGVAYLDTCIEPWKGGYEADEDPTKNTNAYLRSQLLNTRMEYRAPMFVGVGANPGLVSMFAKKAVRRLARSKGIQVNVTPAVMAEMCGVRAIHITECDTQYDNIALKPGEFANTWSVDGFLSEAKQKAEFGLGTHEFAVEDPRITPIYSHGIDGRVGYLNKPGAETKIKSWCAANGEQEAYLITHNESISLSEYFSTGRYRPTVLYAYRPSDKTCESLENWKNSDYQEPTTKTIMKDKIKGGSDTLGVLLIHDTGAYWYGASLTAHQAKSMFPYNNATSLQVVSSIMGILGCSSFGAPGLFEAEHIELGLFRDFTRYCGEITHYETGWRPQRRNCTLRLSDFLI